MVRLVRSDTRADGIDILPPNDTYPKPILGDGIKLVSVDVSDGPFAVGDTAIVTATWKNTGDTVITTLNTDLVTDGFNPPILTCPTGTQTDETNVGASFTVPAFAGGTTLNMALLLVNANGDKFQPFSSAEYNYATGTGTLDVFADMTVSTRAIWLNEYRAQSGSRALGYTYWTDGDSSEAVEVLNTGCTFNFDYT